MQLSFILLRVSSRLLGGLGVVCLLLGGYLAWNTLEFARGTNNADAEVVSYREIQDEGETRFRPRLKFRTVTGEVITFEGQLSTGSPRFAIGERVPVIYRVSKPTDARVDRFTDNWLGPVLAWIVAAASLAGAVLLGRAVRRMVPPSP